MLVAATKSTYTVTVTADDSNGGTDTISVTITVNVGTGSAVGDRYDANNDGTIQLGEAFTAARNHFSNRLSLADAFAVVRLYYQGLDN